MVRNLAEILATAADVLFPGDMTGTAIEVGSCNCNGDTPLHVMCWREDVEAVQVLLQAGADPNASGDMSETPLHVACRVANGDIIERLLAAGARPDIRGELDMTPVDIARANPKLAAAFDGRR